MGLRRNQPDPLRHAFGFAAVGCATIIQRQHRRVGIGHVAPIANPRERLAPSLPAQLPASYRAIGRAPGAQHPRQFDEQRIVRKRSPALPS